LVWGLDLYGRDGVDIVGPLPQGLPTLALPFLSLDIVQSLFPLTLTISLVSFTGSISVAKSLDSKRRQRIEANQELIGLGLANLSAAFSGGVAVTGGLSRSIVNFAAGANTGLASIITALLIGLVVLFFTPLFFYLPRAVLAAIIAVAAAGIIDLRTAAQMWRYSKADAMSLVATFLSVLTLGVELGIAVGVGASVLLFLWRTSKPRVVELGRVDDGELFRSVEHHEVKTYPSILLLRIDESLYFANASQLESQLLNEVAERPQIEHLVLVWSAINYIDDSALETLVRLNEQLASAGADILECVRGGRRS
jgi:SulP family sulfate permease